MPTAGCCPWSSITCCSRTASPGSGEESEPSLNSSADEFSEGSLSSPDPGLAVREQQVIELQGQQPAVGIAQRALDRLGVVADQLVGDEAQLSEIGRASCRETG